MAFKDWMFDKRREAGLTQAQLQELLGKGEGYIAKIESGKFVPPRAVCLDIAKALRGCGVDVSDDEVWNEAAPEVADPDVRRYYERLIEQGKNLSGPLSTLVETIQSLQSRMDGIPAPDPDFSLARAFNDHLGVVAAVAADRHDPSKGPAWADLELWLLLHNLYGLPAGVPQDARKQLVQITESANRGVYAALHQQAVEAWDREYEAWRAEERERMQRQVEQERAPEPVATVATPAAEPTPKPRRARKGKGSSSTDGGTDGQR